MLLLLLEVSVALDWALDWRKRDGRDGRDGWEGGREGGRERGRGEGVYMRSKGCFSLLHCPALPGQCTMSRTQS